MEVAQRHAVLWALDTGGPRHRPVRPPDHSSLGQATYVLSCTNQMVTPPLTQRLPVLLISMGGRPCGYAGWCWVPGPWALQAPQVFCHSKIFAHGVCPEHTSLLPDACLLLDDTFTFLSFHYPSVTTSLSAHTLHSAGPMPQFLLSPCFEGASPLGRYLLPMQTSPLPGSHPDLPHPHWTCADF